MTCRDENSTELKSNSSLRIALPCMRARTASGRSDSGVRVECSEDS
jgi:hypothetical protein